MEQLIEKNEIFKMFSYLLHVLAGKSSIPFPKENNSYPYKCPSGYEPYKDSYDREQFDKLEDRNMGKYVSQKDKEREKVLVYHPKVKVANSVSRFLLDIKRDSRGGQVTVSRKIFNVLFGYNNKIGFIQKTLNSLSSDLEIRFLDKKDFIKIKIESFFGEVFNESYEHNIEIQEKEIMFIKKDRNFSISFLYFPLLNCVSFLEGSIKSNNPDNNNWVDKDLFDQIDKVFRFEVPQIPLFEWFDELLEEEKRNLIEKMKQKKIIKV